MIILVYCSTYVYTFISIRIRLDRLHVFVWLPILISLYVAPLHANELIGEFRIEKKIVSLKECLQSAIQQSTLLKSLKKKQMGAELSRKNVDVYFIPKVSASVAYHIDSNDFDLLSSERVIPTVVISQNIMVTGDASLEMWQTLMKQYEADRAIAMGKSNIHGEVVKKFFLLLLKQKQLLIEEHNLMKYRRKVNDIQTKYRNGMATEFEVAQAELALQRSEFQYESMKNETEKAATSLAAMIEYPDNERVEAEDVMYHEWWDISWERCRTLAEEIGMELILGNAVIEAIPKYRKWITRMRWPSITVDAFGGRRFEIDEEPKEIIGLRLSVKKDIFDSGITSRRMLQAGYKLDEVDILIRHRRKKYLRNVDKLYLQAAQSKGMVKLAKAQKENSEKLFAYVDRAYTLGGIPLKEMLDAQADLRKAELLFIKTYIRAVADEYVLRIQLGLNPFANFSDN